MKQKTAIFSAATQARKGPKSTKETKQTAFLFSITKNKVYKAKEDTHESVVENTEDCFPSFINGFSLENNYLSSGKHSTKKLEIYKNTWDNFTSDYELNDGKENFEVKNLEVFKVVGENSGIKMSSNNFCTYSSKHNDFKIVNHCQSYNNSIYCSKNKSQLIYKSD